MTATKKDLDKLATELFQVFSRTEYALKAAGFHNGNGAAEANWFEFSKAIESLIENPNSVELNEAVTFMLNEPPKRQDVVNGLLQWATIAPNTNSKADKLLQYVRRVRNNLFHGGKFNGHWFAPERSEALLTHSLTILKACVQAVPKVHDAYHG